AAPRKRANCHVSPTPRNHQELHGTLGLGDVLRVLVAQHRWICATDCSRPSTAPLLRQSACLRTSTRSAPARPQTHYASIVSPEPARRSNNHLTGAILYGSDLKRDLNCVPSLRRHGLMVLQPLAPADAAENDPGEMLRRGTPILSSAMQHRG